MHFTLRPGLLLAIVASFAAPAVGCAQTPREWPIHALDRPQPPVVDPGPFVASTPPPSDAVVLFDGRSLEQWRSNDAPARWRILDGAMEVVPGTGTLRTVRAFGDVQLHLEWMAPAPPRDNGQDRGNSGVFFMGRYEVQVLDSYENTTYPDGQAAALYGQHPPLVNASRPPGQWQSYDIVFRAPRFDGSGQVISPARVTVMHNGVLVHDNAVMTGATRHDAPAQYSAHADRLPLTLQDHGAPVRFRNIWIRELEN